MTRAGGCRSPISQRRLACGAAVFKLRLALAVAGTPPKRGCGRTRAQPEVVARLTPARPRPATPAEQTLYAAIASRHSNRTPFWPTPVPADARWQLIEAARAEGAWLERIIGPTAVGALAAHSANRVLERHPDYQAEVARWTRDGDARDGVPIDVGGPAPEPHDLLPQRPFAVHTRAPGRDLEPAVWLAVCGVCGAHE